MGSTRWKTMLEEDESNELVRFSYAKALLDEKNWKDARVQFERLVKDQPDYALAWAFLARSCYELRDFDAARKACDVGMPITRKQKHEVPEEEMQSILDAMDDEF